MRVYLFICVICALFFGGCQTASKEGRRAWSPQVTQAEETGPDVQAFYRKTPLDEEPLPAMPGEPAASPQVPPRIREYFPETLLFEPALITDENGNATLTVEMADSITTWRLTASANTKDGLLGGTTSPLLVFQDFFVDIDFPVALTQNDEVSVPVAIYNYLSEPQQVRLVVTQEPWFELQGKTEKVVSMNAKDVGVAYFRLRAVKVGNHRLTVTAYGSKMSDAVRRSVAIAPDGRCVEDSINGQLSQTVEYEVTIPEYSIPDASRILVKCYPGIASVLLEGLDGMLQLPSG